MKAPWPADPPRGPFRRTFWRSPLRGPWLTSVLGLLLLLTVPIVAITGLLSNVAYDPRLGANAVGRHLGPLDFYLFSWPTSPSWLYALNQGLHVTLGLATIPILLAKLWSVIPRLFEWPPFQSPAHALERLSLILLVGGAGFEWVTGVLNIQDDYAFGFFFTDAHYYGAWVFIAALSFHVCVKFPTVWRNLATRRALRPLLEGVDATAPEPRSPVDSDLIPMTPAAPAGAPTDFRSIRRSPIRGSIRRRSAAAGGFMSAAARASRLPASGSSPCPSIRMTCRSPAWRAGRRRSAGRGFVCATSRVWWAARTRPS